MIDSVRDDSANLANGLAHLAGRLGDGELARLALDALTLALAVHWRTDALMAGAEALS
jgi:hypothetical protein